MEIYVRTAVGRLIVRGWNDGSLYQRYEYARMLCNVSIMSQSFDGNNAKLACYGIKKWCDENIDRLNNCPLVEVTESHRQLIFDDGEEI